GGTAGTEGAEGATKDRGESESSEPAVDARGAPARAADRAAGGGAGRAVGAAVTAGRLRGSYGRGRGRPPASGGAGGAGVPVPRVGEGGLTSARRCGGSNVCWLGGKQVGLYRHGVCSSRSVGMHARNVGEHS